MEPLRPEMQSVRPRPIAVAIALGLFAGCTTALLGSVALVLLHPAFEKRPAPAPPPPAPPPAPIAVAHVEAAPLEPIEPAPGPAVLRGSCGAASLPPGYHTPLDAAGEQKLVHAVATWLRDAHGYGDTPRIEHRRGVAFIESEEDRGDDPPYPRSAAPEATRVCGTAARWLRADLHDELHHRGELTCEDNVCCYGGMEYQPSGLVVFRDLGGTWVLDTWVSVYRSALGEHVVAANERHLTRSLRRLAADGGCRNEPPGAD
jgi:hypothetical protein